MDPDNGERDPIRLIQELDVPCRQDVDALVARALKSEPEHPVRTRVFLTCLTALTALVTLCVLSTVEGPPPFTSPLDDELATGMIMYGRTEEGLVWIGNVPAFPSQMEPGTGIVVWEGGTP